jgi:catechol 2,3-dioxygenase-like lactoylglutathione lyase family enzyme
MQANELKNVIPILDVRDVDRALKFYTEKLGFQVDFRYEEDPNNYAGVIRDGVQLHMQWQHEDEFKKGTAGNLRVRICVDDPVGLFQEFRSKDAMNERTKIVETAWGTREFGFRDPDGNGLAFYRELS